MAAALGLLDVPGVPAGTPAPVGMHAPTATVSAIPDAASHPSRWVVMGASSPVAHIRARSVVSPRGANVAGTDPTVGDQLATSTSESTGVGACGRNSAASARPSAAVATRSRPSRLATKQARSAASKTSAEVVAIARERGDADRGRHGTAETADSGARPLRDGDGHPRHRRPAGGTRTRHRRSGRRGRSRDRTTVKALAMRAQLLIAGLVAHRVVDAAEVVEVEHDQPEGRAVSDGALELVLERRVVQEPGQAVGLGADLDGPVDLGVLERDRDLGREQLDQVELLRREGVADAEALHRQDADRARPTAQRHDDEAAVHRRIVRVRAAEMVDPRVVSLVVDVDRLVVVHDPRRDAGLARLPWLHVVIGVDAARGQRRLSSPVTGSRTSIATLSHAMSPPRRSVMPSRTARPSSVVRIDSVIWSSARWLSELLLERGRLLAQPLGGVGVGHRLGGEARIDHQEAKVVIAELVETELREDEDADDVVLEHHRREEHRFLEIVLGPGDRVGTRIRARVRQVLRDAVLGHPAGDPLADLDPELFGRLVDVLADLPAEGDRDQVLAVAPVHANVVVVDQLPQLGPDSEPDLARRSRGGSGAPRAAGSTGAAR